jgi:hypothetical protein
MYQTRGGSVQWPLTSGPRGWPVGQVLCQFGQRLRAHVSTQEGGRPMRWRKSVEAEPHGRPTNTWQVTDLTKLVTPPWTPINTPLPVEIRTHTTF